MSIVIKPAYFRAPFATNSFDPRNNADAFEARLLVCPDDISAALRLRHRAYAHQGHFAPTAGAEYSDRHDLIPTTAIIGGYDRGRLLASMRLCFAFNKEDLSPLPCSQYYPALSLVAAKDPYGIVEVSRLALEPEIRNVTFRATLYGFMVRSAFAAARALSVSRIVVATKPEWVAMYKRLLNFEEVGEPALYPPGNLKITLLAGSVEAASKQAWTRNRFFHLSHEDVSRMQHMLAPVLKHPIEKGPDK